LPLVLLPKSNTAQGQQGTLIPPLASGKQKNPLIQKIAFFLVMLFFRKQLFNRSYMHWLDFRVFGGLWSEGERHPQ
jgi:hypothetical protein